MARVRLGGAREHLVHGRVSVRAAGGGDARSPLEAELRLVRGGATLGATRTLADGSYTLLFDARRGDGSAGRELWLRVFTHESDPCKRVNITRRCAFARELADAVDAEGGAWIWQQTLEVDARDAFPACPLAPELTAARLHGLQAHEFRDALLTVGRQAVGDVPLSLSEAAIALCYGTFFLLLCTLLRVSRRPRAERHVQVAADLRTQRTPECWARSHERECRVHRLPATRRREELRATARVSSELHVVRPARAAAPICSRATQTPESIYAAERDGRKTAPPSGRAW